MPTTKWHIAFGLSFHPSVCPSITPFYTSNIFGMMLRLGCIFSSRIKLMFVQTYSFNLVFRKEIVFKKS